MPKPNDFKEKKECIEKDDSKMSAKDNKSSRRNRRRGNSEYKGSKGNDIGWHAKSKQLLTDAACIPWSYSTGRNLVRNHVGSDALFGSATFNVPGIFVMRTVLTPGVSTQANDAINIAAQALYTDIRSQLKSANAYDFTDVMIYMCEMAEIKAMIAFIRRILGTPLNYSFMNSYLPDDLIKVQGVNPAGIHADYAKYRSRVNQQIAKASQIWWPKGFDYITRAEWEYSNYFTEGESIKDQIYMYTPGLFRKFTYDATRDYAGMLEPCIKFSSVYLHTMDEVIDALSDMIDSVVGDSDFQNIAGDLFNRYGAGGVETFSLIPDSYIINPSMSYEVLEQIQNSRCLYCINQWFSQLQIGQYSPWFNVAQDEANNILIVGNKWDFSSTSDSDTKSMILDCYDPILTVDKDPAPDKTMLITRCSNVITDVQVGLDAQSRVKFSVTYDTAMEFVVNYEIYTHDVDGRTLVRNEFTSSNASLGTIVTLRMSNFHYLPLVAVTRETSGTYAPAPQLFGSVDIYALITPEQVKDMNRVDLMSLFAVPDVGSVTK